MIVGVCCGVVEESRELGTVLAMVARLSRYRGKSGVFDKDGVAVCIVRAMQVHVKW